MEETDGRRVNYRLTEKGIDLAPILLELLIWGARHEETGAPSALIVKMAKNREEVLAEVRRRWPERDSIPLIPKFGVSGADRNFARTRREASPPHHHARVNARRSCLNWIGPCTQLETAFWVFSAAGVTRLTKRESTTDAAAYFVVCRSLAGRRDYTA